MKKLSSILLLLLLALVVLQGACNKEQVNESQKTLAPETLMALATGDSIQKIHAQIVDFTIEVVREDSTNLRRMSRPAAAERIIQLVKNRIRPLYGNDAADAFSRQALATIDTMAQRNVDSIVNAELKKLRNNELKREMKYLFEYLNNTELQNQYSVQELFNMAGFRYQTMQQYGDEALAVCLRAVRFATMNARYYHQNGQGIHLLMMRVFGPRGGDSPHQPMRDWWDYTKEVLKADVVAAFAAGVRYAYMPLPVPPQSVWLVMAIEGVAASVAYIVGSYLFDWW